MSKNPDNKLTEREIEILGKAWGCMKNQPEIDMAKLADQLGMTNVGSATNAWGRIKKKLFSDIPSSSGSGSGATSASARKRKTTVKSEPSAADSDEDVPETPSKKPKKTPAKRGRKPVKTEEADDDDARKVKNEKADDTPVDESEMAGEI